MENTLETPLPIETEPKALVTEGISPAPKNDKPNKPNPRPGRMEFVEPPPWPEAVDGAALLDELVAAFRLHLDLPPGAAEAMAMWVLFAHTLDAHETSPRLALVSPVPECGK